MKNKNDKFNNITVSFNTALLVFYLLALITMIAGCFFMLKIANMI